MMKEIFSFVHHDQLCFDYGDVVIGLIYFERSSASYFCYDCILDRLNNDENDSDIVFSQDSFRIYGFCFMDLEHGGVDKNISRSIALS